MLVTIYKDEGMIGELAPDAAAGISMYDYDRSRVFEAMHLNEGCPIYMEKLTDATPFASIFAKKWRWRRGCRVPVAAVRTLRARSGLGSDRALAVAKAELEVRSSCA